MTTNSIKSSVRKTTVDILERVFADGMYADEALTKELQRTPFSQLDKSLLVELVNGTIRWHGQLDFILEQLCRGNFKTSPLRLKCILEMSLYQIKFLDKVPTYAAVSQGVEIAKAEGGKPWGNLVNAVLRNYLRKAEKVTLPALAENPARALSIQYSHPEWMVARWLTRYGVEETERLCAFNNERPLMSIRVNGRKTSREILQSKFQQHGIEVEPSRYFGDFFRVKRAGDLPSGSLFQQGYFAIQDESTAIPCLLLSPQSGDVILDLCAAPGGKTCYLADLCDDNATIIAVDKSSARLKLLKQNIVRLGLKSVRTVVADGAHLSLRPVDKILLDAPCSGLGVLARRTDLRWKREFKDIHNIQKLQKALLENADRMLKPGGTLVYSTCTIEPEENETIVRDFLSLHKNYELDKSHLLFGETFFSQDGFFRTLPHHHKMDGSFAVKLTKLT